MKPYFISVLAEGEREKGGEGEETEERQRVGRGGWKLCEFGLFFLCFVRSVKLIWRCGILIAARLPSPSRKVY